MITSAHLRLFDIPVLSAVLPLSEDCRISLREIIRRMHAGSPGIRASNQQAFHSSRDFHALREAPVGALCGTLLSFAKEAIAGNHAWQITECWAVVSPAGGYMTPHTHAPAEWAGVFYVDAAKCCEPHSTDRGGKLELFNPVPHPELFGLPTGVVLPPYDGLCILFPGALSHMVHPSTKPGMRVSVSFNLRRAAS